MKYVVYGAGPSVGSSAAASTSPASRSRSSRAVRTSPRSARDGLVLDAGDGRHRIDAPATDTAADVAWTDDTVVVLAVKSHQAAVALADLREHAPADTASSAPPTASPPRPRRCACSPGRTPSA